MSSNKITLKKIAEIAGVHRSTVDKVIHNRPGVSDAVREKILRILKEKDYQPNFIGRALRNQENRKTIAVVSSRVNSEPYLHQGIQQAVQEVGVFGYDVEYYIFDIEQIDQQIEMLYTLAHQKINGIILQALYDARIPGVVSDLAECGIPVVLLNFDHPGCTDALCYIGQDSRKAGRTAAHLAKAFLHGSGRIAVINGYYEKILNIYDRCSGFTAYLAEIAPAVEIAEIVDSSENAHDLYHAAVDLLRRQQIDCIYATSSGTEGIGKAIGELGLQDRTHIICHDLYPEILRMLREGMVWATLSQDLEKQGYLAFQHLVYYLLKGIDPPSKKILIEVDIRLKENMPET